MKYICEKVRFISYKFRPLIENISAGYRKNLWCTFVRPLFELLAVLHNAEPAKSNRGILDRAFRKSFQAIVKVGKTTPLETQELMIGINLAERGKFLWEQAMIRWECRRRRQEPDTYRGSSKVERDVLKFAPKELIDLVNLTNHLCPTCNLPLSSSHLWNRHD